MSPSVGTASETVIEAILSQATERWRSCEGVPESDLLRLSVLRDLVHSLHAEKSRYLAKGNRDPASSIRSIEDKIEDMRNCKPLSGDLRALLSGKGDPLKRRTRLLPDAVFAHLDREKLERYDRQWEAALVSEGISLGWRIWALEAQVEIQRVDQWHQGFSEQLWPDGIVLFVESARDQGLANVSSWLGRWIVMLHPKFKKSSEIAMDFSHLAGTSSTPSWQLLFSPKST